MMHVHVTVNVEKTNFPLRPVYVGQGSALKIHVVGLPDTATAKAVLTPVSGGAAMAHVSARNADGELEIYVPAWAFPVAGATVYEITAADDSKTYWLGKGNLIVIAAATVADIPNAPVFPTDPYLYVAADQKYHLIMGDQDPVTGLFTYALGQEGYDEVPEGGHAI